MSIQREKYLAIQQEPLDKAEDISNEIFLEHEKKKLSSCKVFSLIPVGDTMAGKSSFVKYEEIFFMFHG